MSTRSVIVTEGIRVEARSFFVPEQSDERERRFFFAYTIVIANEGERPARLVSRHWIITDGHGRIEQVRGPGVVGEQPHLQPGEAFEYTSACPLPTPLGSMQGSYRMVRDDGREFDAAVARFALAVPQWLN